MKLLIALLLSISSLFVVGPAVADNDPVGSYTPGGDDDPARCGAYKARDHSQVFQGHDNADFVLVTTLRFRNCNSGKAYRVTGYQVAVEPTRTSGDICGDVSRLRVNPNIIGGWNPETLETECGNGNHTYAWSAPGVGAYVGPGASSSDRCLGGDFTGVRSLRPDTTIALYSMCLT